MKLDTNLASSYIDTKKGSVIYLLSGLDVIEISKLTDVKSIPKSLVNVITHEECGELIQATSKFFRNNGSYENLCEEIIDVIICCGWLINKYNLSLNDLLNMVIKKTNRINAKMKNGNFITQEGD